jgi:uncharacterized protein YbjT (DUF2867 family)
VVFAEKHHGREYDLTGPEALDHYEVAAIVSEASGRKIVYYAIPEQAMLDSLRQQGAPESSLEYAAMLYRIVRQGATAPVNGNVAAIAGKPPTTFRQFAARNADIWKA